MFKPKAKCRYCGANVWNTGFCPNCGREDYYTEDDMARWEKERSEAEERKQERDEYLREMDEYDRQWKEIIAQGETGKKPMISYIQSQQEKLINCRVCGGQVSSSATSCPHCGAVAFRPTSYLQAQEREKEQHDKNKLVNTTLMKGPRVIIRFTNMNPRLFGITGPSINPATNILIDNKGIHEFMDESWAIPTEDDDKYRYRLRPGTHTVTLYYYTSNMKRKEQTTSFVTTATTKAIEINYRVNKHILSSGIHVEVNIR